jgi:DNA-binding CsgD family transcriptional regulator
MTRLVFIDEEVVMMLEAALPAAELAAAIEAGVWPLPPGLAGVCPPDQQPNLRAVRLGRLVIVSPLAPLPAPLPAAHLPLVTLSLRQHQVLQGLADGLTTRQIGARLGLHDRSVELHIAAIKNRFNTRSRMQSVLRGVALGLCKMRPEPK